MERLEFYILVVNACFRRLENKEKVEAMLEVAEILKEEK